MSVDFLTQVCAQARGRVVEATERIPLRLLRERAAALPSPPSFADALHRPALHDHGTAVAASPSAPPAGAAAGGVAVVAEIKRASPSRGQIARIPDPAALAAAYVDGGAAGVSVLTEPRHFGGDLEDLRAVASRLPTTPALRKDFVVDVYQVWEARTAGAAAVLLIVAALGDAALARLLAEADEAGLDALVETHSEAEVERASVTHAGSGSTRRLVLGVNARNLATLDVDLSVVERVAASRPAGAVLVAESGVSGPQDVVRMAAAGADAILVGEHVATAADPAAAVAELVEAGRAAGPRVTSRRRS